MFTIILAVDENNLIGNTQGKYGLAWSNKEDMQHFKNTTMNHKVLYGANTYKQMGGLLKGRENYIVSRHLNKVEGAEIIKDLDAFLIDNKENDEEIFICGGKSIYLQCLNYADKILVSKIKGIHEGDVYIEPFWNEFNLKEIIKHETFDLEIYERG